MKNIIETQTRVEDLKSQVQKRGLRQGKAFRRHCVRLSSAAAYHDLEAIHQEINTKRPQTAADLGPTNRLDALD